MIKTEFSDLHLSDECIRAISDMGFTQPTEIQKRVIPLIQEGKDVVALSQTGTGKTLAFVAPLLDKINLDCPFGVQVLVMVPTRELAEQVLTEVKKLMKFKPDVKAVAVFGGQEISRQIIALKKGANFVVGTPGRIQDHIGRKTIKLGNLRAAVLDEADEMLNMGFRQDMEKILKVTNLTHQTLMFSATMSKEILALVTNFMKEPVTVQIGEANQTIQSVKQVYFVVGKDKKKPALSELLRNLEAGTTIVFCNTKKMVDGIEGFLKNQGFNATGLHGDMKQNIRRKVMQGFKSKSSQILVTTDISARGIDVKDVLHVINFDLPQNLEYYIHRVGRTGRAGKGGNAYTLINTRDQISDLKEIERKTKTTIKLEEMEFSVDLPVHADKKTQKRPQGLNERKRDVRSQNPNRGGGPAYEKREYEPRRKQRAVQKSIVRGEASSEAGTKTKSAPRNTDERKSFGARGESAGHNNFSGKTENSKHKSFSERGEGHKRNSFDGRKQAGSGKRQPGESRGFSGNKPNRKRGNPRNPYGFDEAPRDDELIIGKKK